MIKNENSEVLEINTIADLSSFFSNNKPLIIETENLIELETLEIMDSILKDLNKNYLSILSKKSLIKKETFEDIDVILFCNRSILNRDNVIKCFFKNSEIINEFVQNPEFDYNSYFEEEEFTFSLTKGSLTRVTFNKSIKTVFINDILSPKPLQKRIITELLENQKIDVLKIKKINFQNTISYVFYDKIII